MMNQAQQNQEVKVITAYAVYLEQAYSRKYIATYLTEAQAEAAIVKLKAKTERFYAIAKDRFKDNGKELKADKNGKVTNLFR